MVAKGSPKLTMIARASPKLYRFMGSSVQKKASPKGSGVKKKGASPRVAKKRADWNLTLERSLVDILHEHKGSGYRGDTGCWSSEGWNRIVKEFHVRNKSVNYTKNQIQDKEGQLKRDYKMLKAARKESGVGWDEDRQVIVASAAQWENLEKSYPKIKKFHNSKTTFLLFDALGELYDGHLAEGTYNLTSLEPPQEEEPLEHCYDVEDWGNTQFHQVQDGDDDDSIAEIQGHGQDEDEVAIFERSQPKTVENEAKRPNKGEKEGGKEAKRPKKGEKEGKRPRKGERIEDMMGRYLDMKTKQAEDESIHLAKEKEVATLSDFSITRCISVLSTMEVTKEEKAKAFQVFIKSAENREAFLSGCQVDQDATLMWLKSVMA